MQRVITGISGGIDSATTALLLKQEGYQVVGLHIQVINPNQNIERIRQIESKLDILIHIINAENEFNNSVIEYFRSEHLKGRSPSPCAICNPSFKWKILNEFAIKNNAKFIATGHYIQKIQKNGLWWLKKGIDEQKDQSYFLWGLNQEILNKIITPLGKQMKNRTKVIARNNGLGFLLNSKESTGLCFSNGHSYSELLEKYIPESKEITSGIIEDRYGKTVGKHRGYIYYTIGQKKDLEIDIHGNYCVSEIDAKKNIIRVDDPKNLWVDEFSISDCYFHNLNLILNNNNLSVKIRGYGWNPTGKAKIINENNGLFKVKLDSPAWAPAPGQPAVFYSDDLVVGGGIIR